MTSKIVCLKDQEKLIARFIELVRTMTKAQKAADEAIQQVLDLKQAAHALGVTLPMWAVEQIRSRR